MPPGPLSGVTNFVLLEYSVTIEQPITESRKELENVVADAVDENIIPDIATRDVESVKVEEVGVPEEEQDLSVIVTTSNTTTSNVTLNEIESDIKSRTTGRVTSVSVTAKLSGPVRRLVSRVMD